MKKIIISLVCVLVVAIVATTVWCLYPAIVGAVNGSRYYTYNDMENQYQTGYNDGNKAEAELTDRNKYLQELVDTRATEIASLNTAYREKLNTLYAEKAELEKLVEPAARVPELEQRIDELQASIAHYEDLLIKIGAEDFHIVNYFVGQELYASQAVKKGDKMTAVTEPTKYATFLGWSLDGKTVVDINEIEVTSNLKLTALFEFEVNIVKYMKSYKHLQVGDDIVENSTTIYTNNLSTIEITEGQSLTYNDLTGKKCVLSLNDESGFYLSASAESLDERYWYSAEGTQPYVHTVNVTNQKLCLYKYKFSDTANLYDPQFVMLNFDAITGISNLLYSAYDEDGNYLQGATVQFNEFTIDKNQYYGICSIPVTANHSFMLTAESVVTVGEVSYRATAIIPLNANSRQLYTVTAGTLNGRTIGCDYGIWGNSTFTGDTSKGHLAMIFVTEHGSGILPVDPNEMH